MMRNRRLKWHHLTSGSTRDHCPHCGSMRLNQAGRGNNGVIVELLYCCRDCDLFFRRIDAFLCPLCEEMRRCPAFD